MKLNRVQVNAAAGLIAAMMMATTVAGCGDDGGSGGGVSAATINDFCNTQCEKFDECGVSFFASVEACIATCTQNSEGQPDDCVVTDAQGRACISAIDASACDELQTTFETSCNFCPEGEDDAGGVDAGAGDGGGSGPASCQELASCCPQVTMDEARTTCESSVLSGNDPLCTQTLEAYRASELCQ